MNKNKAKHVKKNSIIINSDRSDFKISQRWIVEQIDSNKIKWNDYIYVRVDYYNKKIEYISDKFD